MNRTAQLTIAVLGSSVLLGGGMAAYAAFPSTDGVVSTCVLKPGGTIRVIDPTTQSCKKGEVPLSWNQQGRDAVEFARYRATRNSHTDNIVGDSRVYSSTSLCDPGDRLLYATTSIAQDPAHPNELVQQGEPDLLADDGWTVLVRVHPDAQVENAIFAQTEAWCADSADPFDHGA